MSQWPKTQLRRLFRLVNGGTPTADLANWDGEVRWATPVDLARVDGEVIDETQRRLTDVGLLSGSRSVSAGSLILSIRAPIGYVAETTREMAFNQGCRGLVPTASVDTRYFRYQFSALGAALRSRGAGSTFQELSTEALASLPVTNPTLSTQRAIADFLDAETARIDALIAKKRRLAKVLEGRWISELDRRLADFAERFEKGPIRALCTMVLDCVNKTAPTVNRVTDYIMLRTSNVSGGKVWLDDVFYVDVATYAQWSRRERPRRGDVLLTREAPVGNVGILDTDKKVFLGQRLMMYRADPAKSFPKYLLYCLWAPETQRQIDLLGAGSLHEHLRVGDCSKFSIPLAPLDEQKQLVQELGTLNQHIRRTTHALDRQISLLTEHRQALITAAVTGEIEVPGVGVG